MARNYYIQVGKYLHMKETHRTITVHGFTLDKMDSVRDEILEIESVAQIDKTNQTERRWIHNILVSNDITQDELTIIDKICVKMNDQTPCTFTNPSN